MRLSVQVPQTCPNDPNNLRMALLRFSATVMRRARRFLGRGGVPLVALLTAVVLAACDTSPIDFGTTPESPSESETTVDVTASEFPSDPAAEPEEPPAGED